MRPIAKWPISMDLALSPKSVEEYRTLSNKLDTFQFGQLGSH
jgi:hypothetical protein